MNIIGALTIYKKEMSRSFRVIGQTIAAPVITTSLYFVVFGSAIGSRMGEVDGVSYGQFIVPGLIMLSLLTGTLSAASTGIYFPKWTGVLYEILSAPLSWVEITFGYVMAAVSRALIIAVVILGVSALFVDLRVDHPLLMASFAIVTATAFAMFGFVLGIWADSFEKLSIFPTLIITPLSFLGGVFYFYFNAATILANSYFV